MQHHAHVARAQTEHLRHFLVGKILQKKCHQRLLDLVELSDGFVEAGELFVRAAVIRLLFLYVRASCS